ncbi:fluoride efflux transporter FluC [Methanocella arvoryzae]|uniref:Fluoride-specific ion channel FluC n=1 Tax=Methanocella arvoryzae (strain DSM 22066 / NBRC 105507 / MRE50) TaxID=351160 RepID=Q0W0T2_METAR|nr:CrcB family protein [Methanocella arvoryzae]CAJ38011.1 putative camphor resistance protein [Methanocella arvoryzae MRE50]
MDQLILVGAGGAIGSLLRFQISRMQAPRGIPPGTLFVNVTGSFLITLFIGLSVTGETYDLLCTGLLGGYTTFSTFGFETFRLIESRDYKAAGANILYNVAGSLLAAYTGFKVAGLIL